MPNMPTKDKSQPIIITSDWHLRSDTPKCRKDDFVASQKSILQHIFYLADKYNCACVIAAGDLFHKSRSYPTTLDIFLKPFLSSYPCDIPFVYIYGNHDLPNHLIDKKKECNLFHVMEYFTAAYDARCINSSLKYSDHVLVKCVNFNSTYDKKYLKDTFKSKIAVIHEYVVNKDNEKHWEKELKSTSQIFKKYKDFDLIISGDNHQSFVAENKKTKQILINPGCITIQNTNEINYEPSAYLYYPDTHTYERIALPCNGLDCVNMEYVLKEQEVLETQDVSNTFATTLNDVSNNCFNLENHLKKYTETTTLPTEVKSKIKEYIAKGDDNDFN